MDNPLLSIVMPNYNHLDLAKVMIDSIVANDFCDWELIIVDDGSSESTIAALRAYEAQDSRIIVRLRADRQPKGAQTCRNMGLELARGRYIIFFDNDDLVFPFCLGGRVQQMEQRKDLDFMVFPSAVIVDDVVHYDYPINIYGYKVFDDDMAAFARRELPFVVWNNIYRTASLRQKDLRWDEKLASLQDADFNMQTLLCGLRYEYAPATPDMCYRLASSSSAVTRKMWSDAHFQSHAYALRKFYHELQQRFGHRYDEDLYRGVQFILVSVFEQAVDARFAAILTEVLREFDPGRCPWLRAQMQMAMLLAKVFPAALACKLALLPYKLYLRRQLRRRRTKSNLLRESQCI